MDLTWGDIRRDWWTPPNFVSYARALLTVPVCLFILQPGALGWLGFGLLLVAVLSDKLDGWIAKRNSKRWSTKWGKFIDPIVDKILTLSVMVVLCVRVDNTLQMILIVVTVLVMIREIVVFYVKTKQAITSAAETGRASMVLQSVAIVWICLPIEWGLSGSVSVALVYVGLGASLVSGWLYVYEWRQSR